MARCCARWSCCEPAQPIIDAVGDRIVVAVLCTHAHNDHVTVAPELGKQFDTPVLLHPEDEVLWKQTHPSMDYSALTHDQRITVAGGDSSDPHTRTLTRLGMPVRTVVGLTLPAQTIVHTGHGDDTTIGAEAPHLGDWIARGS